MIRLGTRGSQLARTQAQTVADAITAALGEVVELVIVRTEGDNTAIPLDAPSRPGAFVAALRDALLDGRVDVVVHSFKDLPSEPVDGLVVAAIPTRADPRDALCARDGLTLATLPAGARVGTSSPRRAAAIARVRPDVAIVPIRGNVDTRLRKVTDGEVDAAVLAAAGLERLGLAAAITEIVDPDVILPAPAQGALAVECRTELAARLALLDDPVTRLGVVAERAVLRGVDAACTTAVGALATWAGENLRLSADLTNHRGVTYARATAVARVEDRDAAADLGARVARDLLQEA